MLSLTVVIVRNSCRLANAHCACFSLNYDWMLEFPLEVLGSWSELVSPHPSSQEDLGHRGASLLDHTPSLTGLYLTLLSYHGIIGIIYP